MSLINSTAIPSAVATGYEIDNSLRFNNPDNPYLSKTFGTPTNRKIWTFSVWLKRSVFGAYPRIFSTATGAGGNTDNINFMNDDTLRFISDFGQLTTTMKFRDPSAWCHIVYAFDSTQSTEANRLKLYVNGTQVTDFGTANYPTLNDEVDFNSAVVHDLGRNAPEANQNMDGYLAEVYFIDGAAKAPADFGETGDYGEWKPIEYSAGSYGNNGFYLDFASSGVGTASSSTVGADRSGNTNHFTSTNLAATDQMLDTPTSNFCTWNPVSTRESYIGTLTQGNLRYNPYGATMDEGYGMKGTLAVNSGKWYFEVGRRDTGNDYHTCISGVVNGVRKYFTLYSGNYYYSPENSSNPDTIGNSSPGTDGEISGCAFDLENNKIWFAVNGTWANSGNPSNNTGGFALTAGLTEVSIFTEHPNGGYDGDDIMNCGQDSSFQGLKTSGSAAAADGNDIGDFYYTPPTGFLALCTSNLPDVAVTPSEHFNTVLYSGNNTAQRQITGVGFQPSWTWIKGRTGTHAANSHYLFDAVRGVGKQIKSNATSVEATNTNNLYAFDSDGFSLGQSAADSVTNGASTTFVSWNWKANGSGSSNTAGSINSTVSVNADAGFSIVSYTGDGGTATVGHGLSSAPEMIMLKTRDTDQFWVVYHASNTANPETDYLRLNGTNATTDDTYWDDTAPTNALFSLRSGAAVNKNNDKFIAYCFHSVEGYSKVGSYTGNTNADGAFVYTGFKPAYVLIKRSDSTGNWKVYTAAISSENLVNDYFNANTTDVLGSPATANSLDFLSNGFKARSDYGDTNTGTLVYIAFAETPFKYSNAR